MTNVEGIASNDEEKERLIQFNDTLPDIENTISKVSILLEDGIKSVNEVTLESLGVFGVIETLGTEVRDIEDMQFKSGRFVTAAGVIKPKAFLGSDYSFFDGVGKTVREILDWFMTTEPEPEPKKIPKINKDVENFRSFMASIGSRAEQMNFLLKDLEDLFKPALKEMIAVTKRRGYDCSNYSDDEEKIIFTAYKFAEAINRLLNTGLQTGEGKLNDKAFEEAFSNGQSLLDALH